MITGNFFIYRVYRDFPPTLHLLHYFDEKIEKRRSSLGLGLHLLALLMSENEISLVEAGR
jgi:hypothetical protein